MIEPRRSRARSAGLLTLGVAVLVLPMPAQAGWGPTPAQVYATTARLGPIAACSDGAFGAFVAWQEESGVLRAQHVLASGDNDSAWPADGSLVCGTPLSRAFLEVFAYGSGGLLVIWSEPGALRISRRLADGASAPGWPECGLLIGAGMDPVAIPDGAGGLYVGWTQQSTAPDFEIPVLQRIDANGVHPAWPAGGKQLSGPDPIATMDRWVRLAPGPDGDVYAAWVTMSPDTSLVESAAWLTRVTPQGQIAPEWQPPAIAYEKIRHHELMSFDAPLHDIAADGRGGLFHVVEVPYRWIGPPPYEYITGVSMEIRLRRLQPGGATASGWPVSGRMVAPQHQVPQQPDHAPHVLSDLEDGAFLGIFGTQSHGADFTAYRRWTDAGLGTSAGAADPARGKAVLVREPGRLSLAMFRPNGPTGYDRFPNPAWLKGYGLPGSVYETHGEVWSQWYGDVALAPAGDGGTIFFWSQHNQIFGLFARRFGAGGEVVAVPGPQPAGREIRAWFVADAGVRAAGASSGAALADLELFDLSGRRHARLRLSQLGAFDVVLPSTAGLRSGIYFLRTQEGADVRVARVAVVR